MVKKFACLTLTFILIYIHCSSQNAIIPKDSIALKLITNSTIPPNLLQSSFKISETYRDIQGSPYIENQAGVKSVPLGKVYDQNMNFIGSVLAFYNAYNDQMEISTIDDGINYYLLNKRPDFVYIKLHHKTYKVYQHDYKLKYFIILSNNDRGKGTLLKKEKVIFIKGNKQTNALVKGDAASFIRVKDTYYLRIDNITYKLSKKKKNFFPLFKGAEEAIKNYVKENKLKLGSEKDLISIINYYNSL